MKNNSRFGVLLLTFCPYLTAQEGLHMHDQVRYESEIKLVPFCGRMVTIENLTTILSPKERERRRREMGQRLFDVFNKYTYK